MKVEGRYLFHDDDDDDDVKLDNFIHVFVGQVSALWLLSVFCLQKFVNFEVGNPDLQKDAQMNSRVSPPF